MVSKYDNNVVVTFYSVFLLRWCKTVLGVISACRVSSQPWSMVLARQRRMDPTLTSVQQVCVLTMPFRGAAVLDCP